jgi:hypothetical protein
MNPVALGTHVANEHAPQMGQSSVVDIECVSKKRLRLKNAIREGKKRDTNINFIV